MKKALIVLLLLPFVALSQSSLLTWNTTGTPTQNNTHVTGQSMQTNGVTVGNEAWSGFRTNGWGNGANSNLDYTKYIEFRVTASTGYNLAPSAFTFNYFTDGNNGPTKAQVRYSTSSSFTNNGTLLGSEQTLALNANTQLSLSFPSGYTVASGTTLYIRLYAYKVNTDWYYADFYIRNSGYNSSINGPVLLGTTPTSGGVLANTDTVSTISNYNTTVNVTSNDTATNTTISSVAVQTSPSHGTATLSGSNIIYRATTGYSGTDTFTYKITGADGTTSIGTVNVTVTAQVNPTAAADTVVTTKNTATTIAVTSNDTAGNGTISSVAVATAPSHGTAVLSGTSVVYTPATNYVGADSFTYTITNSYGYTATGTVSITVNQPDPTTGALNGTYVISRSAQTEYPQFTSITSAVNTLNTYGVTGAVTFLFKDTTYTNTYETFPFVINSITGGSSTKTVTFKPYPSVTTTITATKTTPYTGVPALFVLKGADYVTFDGSNVAGGTSRNLKLVNGDDISYVQRSVIWIASNSTDGATNNTIKNCYMRAVKNDESNFCVGIYSGNYVMGGNNAMGVQAATADNTNLNITANDFDNVKQGIYINGGSTVTTNTIVKGNDLGATTDESIICPATFINAASFTYTENYIYNLYRNTTAGALISAGVYVGGNSYNGTITRNQMKNFTKTVTESYTFGGIVLESTASNSNIIVANNFIANVSAPNNGGTYLNGYGIAIASGGGYKIYHNSVVLGTSQTGSGQGYSAALYVAGATNVDVRNNIFINNQTNSATRRVPILIDGASTMVSNLNYNCIYSTDKYGFVGSGSSDASSGNYQTSIGGWRSAVGSGKEVNTIDYNPTFTSTTDLHITSATANNALKAGTYLTAVTKDIDGQVRSTTTPAIGADEFGTITITPNGDAGIYCDSATTWNGTAWSNGTPTANKDAIFTGSKTYTGESFYACSLYVLNGGAVEFTGNSTATITHSVNVQGTGSLIFRSGSNLIQIEADQNSGTVTIERESGLLKRLDYTMWASPVVDARTSGFQTLKQFSPATATGRYYTYNTNSGTEGLYGSVDETTTKFTLGKGYLIRMPNVDATTGYNTGDTRIVFTGSFQGTPNNGTIRIPLVYTDAGHSYNAVGNPYASSINITDFLSANSDAIEGALYLWRKNNDQTQTSYATCNLSGYIANAAPGGNSSTGNSRLGNPFEIDSKGSLNTAQGFLVKAKGADKEVIFRNDMRLQNHSTNFFRSATVATESPLEADGTDRLWLNIANTTGSFSQVLVAYNTVTSTGYDNGYDAENIGVGDLNLYTTIATEGVVTGLGIQTRGAFNVNDVYGLSFKAATAGTYTINIDNTTGVFTAGQRVYLKDNVEGIVREITSNSYTFTTEAGDFLNRFTVMYNPSNAALDTEAPVAKTNEVIVYYNNNEINISATAQIKSVVVYDTLGRMLYSNAKVNNTTFASGTLNVAKQVVVVSATLENGQTVTKKIMMN